MWVNCVVGSLKCSDFSISFSNLASCTIMLKLGFLFSSPNIFSLCNMVSDSKEMNHYIHCISITVGALNFLVGLVSYSFTGKGRSQFQTFSGIGTIMCKH